MKTMKKLISFCAMLLLISMSFVVGDTADMSVTVGASGPNVDSVTVADASPTAGTTTQITVTAQITDTNGVDDIKVVGATFTTGAPAGGTNITTMTRSVCTDVDTDTIQCIATYNMQFYDPAQTYAITVTAEDASTATHSVADSFDYSSLVALELDATTIAFGSMAISELKTQAINPLIGLNWTSITDHSYCLDSNEWNAIVNNCTEINQGGDFVCLPSEELSVNEIVEDLFALKII